MSIYRKQNVGLAVSFRVLLKAYEKAINAAQFPLPRPKIENGSTLSKENLFAYCCKDIGEHFSSQKGLIFLSEQNNKRVFFIMKFNFHERQLILAELLNINYHEIYSPHKNGYLIGYNCGLCESNYDI